MTEEEFEMKRNLHEIWKEQEGSKTVWKVQAPKGILTFKTKKLAMRWVKAMEFTYGKIEEVR